MKAETTTAGLPFDRSARNFRAPLLVFRGISRFLRLFACVNVRSNFLFHARSTSPRSYPQCAARSSAESAHDRGWLWPCQNTSRHPRTVHNTQDKMSAITMTSVTASVAKVRARSGFARATAEVVRLGSSRFVFFRYRMPRIPPTDLVFRPPTARAIEDLERKLTEPHASSLPNRLAALAASRATSSAPPPPSSVRATA